MALESQWAQGSAVFAATDDAADAIATVAGFAVESLSLAMACDRQLSLAAVAGDVSV